MVNSAGMVGVLGDSLADFRPDDIVDSAGMVGVLGDSLADFRPDDMVDSAEVIDVLGGSFESFDPLVDSPKEFQVEGCDSSGTVWVRPSVESSVYIVSCGLMCEVVLC